MEYRKGIREDSKRISNLFMHLVERGDFDNRLEEAKERSKEREDHFDRFHYFVCIHETQLIGYIIYEQLDYTKIPNEQHHHLKPNSGFLFALAVHENYRNKGIGCQLMKYALEDALQKYKTVFSTCGSINAASEKIHLKCGMDIIAHYDDPNRKLGQTLLFRKDRGS